MAITFDATQGNQSLNQSVAVVGAQYPCSMACWMQMPAQTTVEMSTFTIGHPSAASALILGANSFGTTNGLLYAQLSQSGSVALQAFGPLPVLNTWTHFVVVVNTLFHITLYVNGVPTLSGSGGPDILFDVSDTRLGALLQAGTVTHFWSGTIAYPAAWTSGLSASDVAALYNGGTGSDPRLIQSGTQSSFSLLQGSGPFFDVGTQSNWTVNGSPTLAVADPFVLNIVPTVTAAPATNIAPTTITINGAIASLNAGPNATQYGFFYGTTTAYGLTFSSAIGSYGVGPFSANVTGLVPGTLYHFQAWVQAPGGLAVSSDATFSNQPGFTRGEVLYNGPQIYTGQVSAGNPVNVLDSNELTTFTTQSSGTLGVDCGIPTQLTRLRWSAIGAQEDRPLNNIIQASQFSSTFTGSPPTLFTITTRALVGSLSNEIDFSIAPSAYRYYRLKSSGKSLAYSDTDWIGLWTLGVISQPVQPVASPPGGNFDEPIVVRLTTLSTSATIYYTLDGSTPTTNSTQYTGPFAVGTNSTLKAISYDAVQTTPTSRVSSYIFLCPSILYAQQFIYDDRNIRNLTDSGCLFLDPVSKYYFYYLSCRDMAALTGGSEPQFFQGASVYRSADLRNWKFMGQVMGAPDGSQVNFSTTNSIRVQVYYCAATQLYVGWSSNPSLHVWTSPNPDATVEWTLVATYNQANPPGDGIAATGHNDIGSFTDPVSGNAYIIYNYNNNTRTAFSLLDPTNYTNTVSSGSMNQGLVGEAPTLFYRNGVYFYFTSLLAGFAYTLNTYQTGSTPIGPWSSLQTNPFQNVFGSVGAPGNAYHSQVDQVLSIPGRGPNAYFYIGDNYNTPSNIWGEYNSMKLMIPIQFTSNTSFTISWQPGTWVDGSPCSPWQLDTVFPTVSGAPAAVSAFSITSGVATWTNNETNPYNGYWDGSDDSAFTRNVISEVLPTGASSFTIAIPKAFNRIRQVNVNGSTISNTIGTAPSLTIVVAQVTQTTAVCTGTITDLNSNGNATAVGFNFGPSTNYTMSVSETGSFGLGSFTLPVSGLPSGVPVHFQAFATNDGGTGFSPDIAFTTISEPSTALTSNDILLQSIIQETKQQVVSDQPPVNADPFTRGALTETNLPVEFQVEYLKYFQQVDYGYRV